jgi:Zn-dependent membrane protease YugP
VYNNASIAAAAVAAHECGHAVQHHVGYTWLTMRSKMVPTLSLSSKFMPFILMGGMLLIRVFPALLLVGIILFAITTIFSIVTLPVEVDASRRALAWLETTNMTRGEEHDKAKDALKWAAYTYFAAAIGSLVTLLYYINIYLGNRNRN